MSKREQRERVLITYAVVYGSGRFPMDMLRYDRCFPHRSEDARAMEGDQRDMRAIVVERRAAMPDFTVGRWKSFGWQCADWHANLSEALDDARRLNESFAILAT